MSPISCPVGPFTAWTIPPNSQGYLGPATLAVFEMLDPPRDPADPGWWHLLIEAFRSVAWERDDLVADQITRPSPQICSSIGVGWLAPPQVWTRQRREAGHGGMGAASSTTPSPCVVDGDGMAVSIIQSNYHPGPAPTSERRAAGSSSTTAAVASI